MATRVRARVVVVLVLAALAAACAPRLDEQQVRARLVADLHLSTDRLRVRSITTDTLPVAVIEYGGVPATLQFRRQDDVWVVEAVERDGRWESADRALAVLGRELTAKARAVETADVMGRYARTLRLFVAWSTLLAADCETGLPASERALLNLHATWHRTLFAANAGQFSGELHNPDLFLRDAWWKPLEVAFSAARVDVQSSGPDGRMNTGDDVRLTYSRALKAGGTTVCRPAYTMPADAVEALGRRDAPPGWNCADLIAAFKEGRLLTVVGSGL